MTPTFPLQLSLGSTTVDLRTDREELRDALAHVYAAFVNDNSRVASPQLSEVLDGSEWTASLDGQAYRFAEFYSALKTLEDRIAHKLLGEWRNELLLHSSAVANTQDTILVAGRSGAGKTTLALELVCRGMRYLTDEFVAIRGDKLQPFPRSAAQKHEGPKPPGVSLEIPHPGGYRAYLLPDFRADLESVSLDSAWLFFAERVPAKQATVRRIGAGETAARLMTSTFHLEGRVSEVWPDLSDFIARTKACVLEYDRAEDAVDVLLDVVEAGVVEAG